MSAFLRRLTLWCCQQRWSVLALALLCFAFSVWTLVTRLAVVTDTDAMIDPTLEYRKHYAAFQEAYPSLGDTLAIVIEAQAPELRQRAAKDLAAALRSDKAHFADVYAPSVMPFFQDNGLLLLSYDDLADRLDALIAAQPFLGPMLRAPSLNDLLENLAEAKREAENESQKAQMSALIADIEQVMLATMDARPAVLSFQNAIEGEDTRPFDVIIAQPVLDPTKLQPAKAALLSLQNYIADVEAASIGVLSIAVTGKIALNAEELKTVSAGAATAGILSGVFVTLVLLIGVRSVRGAAAMVLNLFLGLTLTGAVALWAFGALNIISVAFAVLFIGLGIDFSIHILLRARELGRSVPLADALGEAAGTSGLALAICAPTTALAFLSFTPTGYAGLAQLGAIAAFGVFVALITSLTVLPALLTVLGMRRSKPYDAKKTGLKRSPSLTLLITAALLLPAIYLASKIDFSADPIALKDAASPSVITYKTLAARGDSSPYAMQILAQPNEVAAIAAQAKSLASVGRVVWLGSFLPREQADKLDLVAETYDLLAADLAVSTPPGAVDVSGTLTALTQLQNETSSPVIADFKRIAEADPEVLTVLQTRLFETLPDLRRTLQRQLGTQGVSAADVPETITRRYKGRDGTLRLEVLPAAPITTEDDLEAFVNSIRSVFPQATGSPVQIIESGKIVRRAMLQATATAFVLVSLLLCFILRSLRQVMFVLCPVILAGIFTLATASALGISFNFANVIVLPLLLGLGVDAGIHYVKRVFETDLGEAELGTGTTGRAVFLSAVTTIGSFGTLMISGHDGTASMGQLLTIALCWLLVTTLIVLPALLVMTPRK